MKTLIPILLLLMFHFHSDELLAAEIVRVSPSPIELLLNTGVAVTNIGAPHHFLGDIEFGRGKNSSTNIALQVIFRNVGNEAYAPHLLFPNLSIVWDGKEYKQAERKYDGAIVTAALSGEVDVAPKSSRECLYALSDFGIPPEALTSGRHTVCVRERFWEPDWTMTNNPPIREVLASGNPPTATEVESESNRLVSAESTTLTVFLAAPH